MDEKRVNQPAIYTNNSPIYLYCMSPVLAAGGQTRQLQNTALEDKKYLYQVDFFWCPERVPRRYLSTEKKNKK